MSNKTFVACRPGMKSAAEAAFHGMEIVVDDTLTSDWEFRERPKTFDEMMEDEISKEERVEADPKNALTFVVPVALHEDAVSEDPWNPPYLAIRVESNVSRVDVVKAIRATQPTLQGSYPDEEVNVSATIGSLKAALKKAGFNVLSISEADGLTLLKDA
jgi:hypothetical protein